MKRTPHIATASLFVIATLSIGCGRSTTTTAQLPQTTSTSGQSNTTAIDTITLDSLPPEIEGHSHDQELGPNGGHIVHMEPGDIRAEWVQLDEDEVVKVFLPDVKEPQTVMMTVSVKDGDAKDFTLEQDAELGDHAFSITSPELITAFKMKEQELVQVSMKVQTGDALLEASIEHVGCSCGNH